MLLALRQVSAKARKSRNEAAPVKIRAVQKITASVTATWRPDFRVSTPPGKGGDF
jgi:hypothetical protein